MNDLENRARSALLQALEDEPADDVARVLAADQGARATTAALRRSTPNPQARRHTRIENQQP